MYVHVYSFNSGCMMVEVLMHAADGIERLTLAHYTSYLEDDTYRGTSSILPRRDEDREVAI